MLYNDLCAYIRARCSSGFLTQDLPWAADLVASLRDCLWYIEPNIASIEGRLTSFSTFQLQLFILCLLVCAARFITLPDSLKSVRLRSKAGRGERGNRGVYNDYAHRKDRKPQLDSKSLDTHLGLLDRFCKAPRLQALHFRQLRDDLVLLCDALSSYITFLDSDVCAILDTDFSNC